MLPKNEALIADAAKSFAESFKRLVDLFERIEKAVLAQLAKDEARRGQGYGSTR